MPAIATSTRGASTAVLPGPTAQLSAYACAIRYQDLPADVVHRVKLTLVDTVGVTLAAGASGFGAQVAQTARALGSGEEATVLAAGGPAGVTGAAMANGALSDILEWQDGWRFGGLHPSLVIAAALALGESRRVGGRALVPAIVAGYEVANRVAATAHPAHMARGYMPNGTAGSIGSAAAAAHLLGLDAARTAHALGIAAFLLPVSTAENLWRGHSIKSFHTGYAARMGIEAAMLAQAGFDSCPIEGSPERGRGFMEVMTGQMPDFSTMTRDLGGSYTIRQSYFKFYPACRLGHAAIEAALQLAAARPAGARDIASAEVRIYDHAAQLLNRYLDAGASMAAALYSLPYNVATALIDGSYGLPQLDETHRNDPAVLDLARRVAIVADDAMTRRYPETTPAEVAVTYRDGAVARKLVEMPPGDPRRETGDDDIFAKFDSLAAPVLGAAGAACLRGALMSVEECPDIGGILRTVRSSLY